MRSGMALKFAVQAERGRERRSCNSGSAYMRQRVERTRGVCCGAWRAFVGTTTLLCLLLEEPPRSTSTDATPKDLTFGLLAEAERGTAATMCLGAVTLAVGRALRFIAVPIVISDE